MNIVSCKLSNPIAKNLLLIGAVALNAGLMSCNRNMPYKEVQKEEISLQYREALDSFTRENKEILNDPNYIKFGEDTLRFEKFYLYDRPRLDHDLEKGMLKQMPKTCIGEKKDLVPIFNGKTVVVKAKKRKIYENHFINTKTVVASDKIFTKRGNDIYIPIQYYGEPNPKFK